MSKLRPLIIAFALVCFLVIGLVIGRLLPLLSPAPPQILNTATILRQVQGLSQLVTVKYVMEKVVVLKDVNQYLGNNFLGESHVTIIAHGVVKAGVDLSQLQPTDVKTMGKKVEIILPAPLITDGYLDDHQTQVLERTTGLMRTFDKDLEQNARLQAVSEIISAARKEKILDEASERARTQLTTFFHQLGFEQVEFRSK